MIKTFNQRKLEHQKRKLEDKINLIRSNQMYQLSRKFHQLNPLQQALIRKDYAEYYQNCRESAAGHLYQSMKVASHNKDYKEIQFMHGEAKNLIKEGNWLTKPNSFVEDPDFIEYKVNLLETQVKQSMKQIKELDEELSLYLPEKQQDTMYV